MGTKNQFKEVLKSSGMKVTLVRVAVLSILSKEEKPLDAEEIYKKLKSKNTDLATIHRTLKSFKEKEIIKEIDLRKKSVFYELSEKHRHYLVCLSCGLIENFNFCSAGKISKDVLKSSKKFRKIKDHSLELFGVCRKCEKAS